MPEANFWGSIVHGNWHDKILVIVAVGDHQRLRRTVTGGQDEHQVNPGRLQLTIPPFTRLTEEGFPHVFFRYQNRMHSSIAKFPNLAAYSNKLETAERYKKSLDVNGFDGR